ncbi:eCIS core domain-containing protein [Streptomyces sp. NBC_00576]|uniref:eCIS core domain-containing protein n=1 Tax=Streptomyces sp. NBC_00576 TaxID=2903665 RepID=UPI002E803043|nr:DUF4157 domain-containing protein [Streptomyces sp. NBC_00576]WUB73106.1 DUF4157 domain-containing protein [Streptomyces sp. NBC_00576]
MRTSGAHAEQNETRQATRGPATARRETSAGSAVPPPLTADALRAAQSGAGNAAVTAMIARRARPAPAVEQLDHGVDEVLGSAGKPLAAPVRQDMESRFDTDFSDVRLHTGATAARSARAIGARAYTSGSHVVLGDGGGDKHTLAHELTHVVQQRQGPVAGTDNGAGLSVSDPSDRFEKEAEANAKRVMSTSAPSAGAGLRSSGGHEIARSVDHRALSDDTAVQRVTDVQRQELDIQGGNEGPTTIRSASDLLVWLVGHPVHPAPRNYAEPAILQRVLARLERLEDPVGHDAVWNALREVVAARQRAQEADSSSSDSGSDGGFFRPSRAQNSDDSSSDEESERSSVASSESLTGENWDEGTWGEDEFGVPEPLEFRRDMPEDALEEHRQALNESLSGYRLVGFHGTHIESVGSLITHGPDLARAGMANGIGKGVGFYVAPVVGPQGVKASGTAAAKKEAKTWGKFLVAVYVKNGVDVQKALDDEEGGVGFESDSDSGSGPVMTYHGSDELVIPAELFDSIRLVRNADDVAMTSDPSFAAEEYEDGVSQYNKASEKGKPRR